MSNYSKKFIALDLETTHLSPDDGKIMEASAIEVELVFDLKKKEIQPVFGKEFDSLINPEIDVPFTALELTGIRAGDLGGSPLWKDKKSELKKFIGDSPVLGHNVGFDLKFLKAQGLDLKNNQVFDSLNISQMLMPLLTSHSLEFLKDNLGIKIKESHRALADSKVSAWVVARSLTQLMSYDKELKEQVFEILSDSNLSIWEFLKDLPESATTVKTNSVFQSELSLRPESESDNRIKFDWKDQTIYTFPISFIRKPEWLNDISKQQQTAVVGVSHSLYLRHIPAKQMVLNPNIALCEERFDQLLNEKSRLSPVLRGIIVKVLIKRFYSDTDEYLDLSKIKFSPDERAFIGFITVDTVTCTNHNCRYIKEVKRIRKQPVFVDLGTAFSLFGLWPDGQDLLLFDLAEIERSFTDFCTRSWNLERAHSLIARLYPIDNDRFAWISKLPLEAEKISAELDMFFGILHLVYLKKDGEFSENIVIDQMEKNSQRFQKLLDPANKLTGRLKNFTEFLNEQILTESDKFLKGELGYLHREFSDLREQVEDIFLNENKEQVSWLRFNSQWVDLNRSPVQLHDKWSEFVGKFSKTSIVDTVLPDVSLSYFMKQFGIENFIVKKLPIKESKKLSVGITDKDFSVEDVYDLTKNFSGSKIIILPNENQLKKYFEFFLEKPNGLEVAAYKYSGSLAKLKNQIRIFSEEKKEFVLLLTLNSVIRYFKELPTAENLLITRLPFEAPGSSPIRHQAFGRSDFIEVVIPRTIDLLHRIIFRFAGQSDNEQRVFLLDARVSQNYDQIFLKYLNEFPEFEIFE